jgi:hypothetical protein
MNIGKSNATSFKKGHTRIPGAGRKPGTPNRTTQQLKDAILEAADRLGYIREEPKLDDKGKPTGEIELVHDGKDATVGYLMWLDKHNPASFAALTIASSNAANTAGDHPLAIIACLRSSTVS